MAYAAGPLLVASQTRDPFLVAMSALLQHLPWLLFGLHAGAVADWVDRRRLAVLVDLARTTVLVMLTVILVTGNVSIVTVLVTVFLLGTGEVFADTATESLLPMVVDKADLGVANSRLMAGHITMNTLAGPAVGAVLFATGMAWPFLVQAVCVGLGVVLLLRISRPVDVRPVKRQRLLRDIAEGLRWTRANAAVRTLTVTIVVCNVTWGAAWSVLVLYSSERLGFGPVGFGLLTTVSAVGGLVGTAAYDWLERHMSLGAIIRVGLVLETLTHLALAVTTTGWVAMVIMFVFGLYAFVWGTTARTVRMRAVPLELQGRVGSTYRLGVYAGLIVGQALGGVIGSLWGVTGPFWFAFVGSALPVAVMWRQLTNIAHAD